MIEFIRSINPKLLLSRDSLLKEIAQRLTNYFPEKTCIARIGNDEFSILLHYDNDANPPYALERNEFFYIINPNF